MTYLPFVLAAAGIGAAWLPLRARFGAFEIRPWHLLAIAAVVAALATGAMLPSGLWQLALLTVAATALARSRRPRERLLLIVLCTLVGAAMAGGLLDGFPSWNPVGVVQLAPGSPPFSLRLTFGSAIAGLVVLGIAARAADAESAPLRSLAAGALAAVAVIALIAPLGMAFGVLLWEPKFPAIAGLFTVYMVFFVAVPEEALFRGLIQAELHRRADHQRWRWMVVPLSALIFGAAHARGGPVLVAVVTVAGVACALAYSKTRRIEAPILAHAGINLLHFYFFSYPVHT